MNLDLIYKGKEVKVKYLEDVLKKSAEDDFVNNIGKYRKDIKEFVAGKQWRDVKPKHKNNLVDVEGNPLYDFSSTYGYKLDKFTKPKRVVNKTKSKLETLASIFAEVDPLPRAEALDDFSYDEDLIYKNQLVLNTIFLDENDFNAMYKVYAFNSLQEGYYFAQIAIDEDKSKTVLPIKFRYVDPEDVRVDPEAVTIDEADFFIHSVKMKFYQMKELYDYKPEYEDKDEAKREPKEMELVTLDNYYIRYKKDKKTQWRFIPVYESKALKFKNTEETLDFDELPFEIFRGKPQKRWYGDSIVIDMIPSAVEYNKAVSEQDFMWEKVVDPPTKGSAGVEKVKAANVPGGHLSTGANEDVSTLGSVTQIPTGEYTARLQTINEQMDEVVGQVDTASGRKPVGVYSNNLMQTIQKAAQLKPRMMEEEYLKTIKRIAYKAVHILANYLGDGTVYLYDSRKKDTIGITAQDLLDSRYKLKIETKDANLLTAEARFDILKDMMQYAKIQEIMHPYYLVRAINARMNGLFPPDVEKKLKDDMDKTATPQPGAEVPSQGGAQTPPEIDDATFNQEVENNKQQMLDAGIAPNQVEAIIDEAVNKGLQDGVSKEQILAELQEATNKLIGIGGQNG